MTETNIPTTSPAQASIRFLFRELTERGRDEQEVAQRVGIHAAEIGASAKDLAAVLAGTSTDLQAQALETFSSGVAEAA